MVPAYTSLDLESNVPLQAIPE